jgi:hypothetical protein
MLFVINLNDECAIRYKMIGAHSWILSSTTYLQNIKKRQSLNFHKPLKNSSNNHCISVFLNQILAVRYFQVKNLNYYAFLIHRLSTEFEVAVLTQSNCQRIDQTRSTTTKQWWQVGRSSCKNIAFVLEGIIWLWNLLKNCHRNIA